MYFNEVQDHNFQLLLQVNIEMILVPEASLKGAFDRALDSHRNVSDPFPSENVSLMNQNHFVQSFG